MKIEIFSVYDSKAEAYLTPFFLATKGLAIRSFTQAINDVKHQFAMYPADYTLFHLGTYDDSKGSFDILEAKVNLGSGLEYKSVSEFLPEEVDNIFLNKQAS